jgi:hypothetical protein
MTQLIRADETILTASYDSAVLFITGTTIDLTAQARIRTAAGQTDWTDIQEITGAGDKRVYIDGLGTDFRLVNNGSSNDLKIGVQFSVNGGEKGLFSGTGLGNITMRPSKDDLDAVFDAVLVSGNGVDLETGDVYKRPESGASWGDPISNIKDSSVATIEDLLAAKRGIRETIVVNDPTRGGEFYFSEAATQDDGIVFPALGGGFWVRRVVRSVHSSWFPSTQAGFVAFVAAAAGKEGILDSNFVLTDEVELPSNTNIRGWGTLSSAAQIQFLWANGKTNIILSGFTLTGNRASVADGTLPIANGGVIKLEGCTNIEMTELRITQHNAHGIYLYNCSDAYIGRNVIDGIGVQIAANNNNTDGILISGNVKSQNILIEGNRIANIEYGRAGQIAVGRITDGDGIQFGMPVDAAYNVVAQNNYIYDCGRRGIKVQNSRIRCLNNQIDRCATFIGVIGGVALSDIQLIGNHGQDLGEGIFMSTTPAALEITNLIIEGNSLKNIAGFALYYSNSARGVDNIISNNYFENIGGNGLNLIGDRFYVTQNTIKEFGKDAVVYTTASFRAGILLGSVGGVNGCVIDRNRIVSTDPDAQECVYVLSINTNVVLTNNYFDTPLSRIVYFQSSASGLQVQGNRTAAGFRQNWSQEGMTTVNTNGAGVAVITHNAGTFGIVPTGARVSIIGNVDYILTNIQVTSTSVTAVVRDRATGATVNNTSVTLSWSVNR